MSKTRRDCHAWNSPRITEVVKMCVDGCPALPLFAEATKQLQAGQDVAESSKTAKEGQPWFLQVNCKQWMETALPCPFKALWAHGSSWQKGQPRHGSCTQLGSHSDLRVFTVLASFAQRLMLSMQTGTIWMIQNISQALFGLHNCSSSGNCQGFCVFKERKRYSACNIGSGRVLGSTFHGPISVVLDFVRVSSCHWNLFTLSHSPGTGSQLFLSWILAGISRFTRSWREDVYVRR